MATVHDHSPLFGKDILSRMLDMEKLSQIQRDSRPTARAVLATSASTNKLPTISTQEQTQNARPERGSMAPPPRPIRSSTTPNLSLNMPLANQYGEIAGSPGQQQPEPTSPSICHSPTWSTRGKDKSKQSAKKAAKEKKEMEKRMKKEEEKKRASATKPNKRLSKKPPPAMETQRMPMTLSRPSDSTASPSRDTSVDRSRPSSKDGRRSSISSLASLMRISPPFLSRRGSSSQPQSPAPESAEDPKKTSHPLNSTDGARKRRTPPEVSIEADEEAAYLKDLKEFAYQVNDGSFEKSAATSSTRSAMSNSPFPSPMLLSSDLPSRGSTNLMSHENVDEGAALKHLRNENAARQDRRAKGVQDNTPRGYHYPSISLSSLEAVKKFKERKSERPYSCPTPQNSLPSLSTKVHTTPNANSYVKKQRVHQQERSITGYQDELAVSQAIKVSNMGPNMPPTPAESTDSLDQTKETRKREPGEGRASAKFRTKHESTEKGQVNIPVTVQLNTPNTSKTRIQSPFTTRPALEPGHGVPNILQLPRDAELKNVEPIKPLTIHKKNDSQEKVPGVTSSKDLAVQSPRSNATKPSQITDPEPAATQDRPSMKSRTSHFLSAPFFPKFSRASTDPGTSSVQASTMVTTEEIEKPTPTSSAAQPEVPSKSPLRVQRQSIYNEAATFQIVTEARVSGQEVVVEGVDGDGLIRKTSIKRPRSDPELNVNAAEAIKPDLAFLPELKHQPLVKPKRATGAKVSFAPSPESPTRSSQFPVSVSAVDLASPKSADILAVPQPPFAQSIPGVRRQSAIKASKRSSFGSTQLLPLESKSQVAGQALNAKPIAKMFVICCKCKYWHDLPSSLYEAMALPRTISQEDGVAQSLGASNDTEASRAKVAGQVFTTVRCPWCEHGMSTGCCAGWTSVVYLHERHH